MIEEAKEKEVQMQNKLKATEQQVKVLSDRDQEVSFCKANYKTVCSRSDYWYLRNNLVNLKKTRQCSDILFKIYLMN